MATIKFKAPSPYSQPIPAPPPEDYLYKIFENDRALTCDKANDVPIKVAIFGVGRAGMIHLTNVVNNSRTKLMYIVDDNEQNYSKIKKHFRLNDIVFLNSKQSDRVFKDPSVDAVIVASPTHTHEYIVTKALEAKMSVFCEKPVAENRINTEKCFEAAKKVSKPLFTAFNRRFDPSYNAVRDRVRKGEVGHVHTIKLVSRDSPIPTIEYLKESGGIFHDCMVHDIDMITWILGEYPTRVSVQASANIPEINAINDFDTVLATLKFPSGTLGIMDLSRNSNYGYDMRLEAFGPKGLVRAENEQPIHCVETMYGYNGPNHAPIWYSFASRFRLAYMHELEHFIDITLNKTEPRIMPKETLAVCKIAAACEESARTAKMVDIKWANGELP